MVTYNAVGEASETIDSIFPHLDAMHELIVVDGGSTDGTVDVLKSYSHPSYRYISEKDEGIYDAMNKGAMMAKGDWITFINCGDKLVQFPEFLDSHCDMECFAVETELGCVVPQINWAIRIRNTLPHQGIYYNKHRFTGFDKKLKVYADYDYNLKVIRQSRGVSVHSDVVAFHSVYGVSSSGESLPEWRSVVYRNFGFCSLVLSMLYYYVGGFYIRTKKSISK